MSKTANQFHITVPITRCYLRKSDDGTEKYVVEGLASNTDLDLTGERMAESAIASMAKSIESHKVLFKSEHHDDWDAEFGEVVKLTATTEHELFMEAELDPEHYRTKTLVKALERGKQLGLSIGGIVVEAAQEWAEELGRKVKTYKDILLEEISVTGSPAVSDTWLSNITKSVAWKDEPMKQDQTLKTDAADEQQDTADTTADETATTEADEATDAAEEAATDETATSSEDADAAAADDQKDEETADSESATEEADAGDDTASEETQKGQYLGEWLEADAVSSVVYSAADALYWQIGGALMDADKSPDEKKSAVDGMLSEFHQVVLRVATALIDGTSTEKAADAAQAFQTKRENLTKSLTEKDAKLDELTKSLEAASAQLEETKQSLTKAEAEVEKLNARKAIVFDKFAGALSADDDQEAVAQAAAKAAEAAATKTAQEIAAKRAIEQQNRDLAAFMTGAKI